MDGLTDRGNVIGSWSYKSDVIVLDPGPWLRFGRKLISHSDGRKPSYKRRNIYRSDIKSLCREAAILPMMSTIDLETEIVRSFTVAWRYDH